MTFHDDGTGTVSRRLERERTLNHRTARDRKYAPAKLNVDRLARELHGTKGRRAR